MKSKVKLMVSLMLVMMLVVSSVAYAAAPSEGLRSSDGEILSKVSTYAGSGEFNAEDGAVDEASFRGPRGLAVMPDGSVLVSDSRNHLIRQIQDGKVSTYAGLSLEEDALGFPLGGMNDHSKETAVFSNPSGIAVDAAGNVYVADTNNHAIRKISADGEVVTLAGNGTIGSANGRGEAARFYHPQDIVVAEDGSLYVADTANHLIRKINPNGVVSTLNAAADRVVEFFDGIAEETGDYQDGPLAEAKFNEPNGLALDSQGNLYVSDTGNQLIRYIDFEEGTVSTVAGYKASDDSIYEEAAVHALGGYVDGPALDAMFFYPRGLAVTAEGGLLIADSLNHAVRYLYEGEVITLAGSAEGENGRVNGINGYNRLHLPSDVAVLEDGSILIADSYNEIVRQFTVYQLPADLPVNEQVKVVLDSEVIAFDVQPELAHGRTMVPVRALSEALGYDVEFDEDTYAVYLSKDEIKVELYIGQEVMVTITEGTKIEQEIDMAPYIKQGRTFVPVRFFSEAFGLDVQWDQTNRTVILREAIQ